jgi:hypothetical protein
MKLGLDDFAAAAACTPVNGVSSKTKKTRMRDFMKEGRRRLTAGGWTGRRKE